MRRLNGRGRCGVGSTQHCHTLAGGKAPFTPCNTDLSAFIKSKLVRLWIESKIMCRYSYGGKADYVHRCHIPGANWPVGGSSNPSFRVYLVRGRLVAVCFLFSPLFYLYNTCSCRLIYRSRMQSIHWRDIRSLSNPISDNGVPRCPVAVPASSLFIRWYSYYT